MRRWIVALVPVAVVACGHAGPTPPAPAPEPAPAKARGAGAVDEREREVRQAEAAEQSALYGYEQTVQSAFADVENALIAQQKTVQKLAAQKALVDALSEYSRLARLQYRGGYVPYSTVLQADQQLFPAQLTLAQDRAQVFGAAVSVYQALGGGWVTLADGMTTEKTPSRRADAAQAVQ